jgi:sulfite reductase (ferredoxin)
LVAKVGIEEFRRLVEEERKTLPHDDRWTSLIENMAPTSGEPTGPGADLTDGPRPDGFDDWFDTNVRAQRQDGYSVVTLNLPLGDLTADQSRTLADIARSFTGDNLRTTVEQNIVLRFVRNTDLVSIFEALTAAGIGTPGGETIVDVTSCPGTDTCKLGIAASRGLGGELRQRLAAKSASMPAAVKALRVKISGCFNSCGQHHLADIGFYGNSRKVDGRTVPHFQVILGGQWGENAGHYGMAMGSVPSKAAPEVVEALTEAFAQGRESNETFRGFVERMGKRNIREIIKPFMKVAPYAEAPEFYSDWSDVREFTMGDLGIGECAGEMVSLFGIEVVKAESQGFDAQVALEEGDFGEAEDLAYRSMLSAARALVRLEFIDVTETPNDIVSEFKTRYFDNERFYDRFAKGKFGQYLLDRHAAPPNSIDRDIASRRIEESQLFIEAAHACELRIETSALAVEV